MTASVADLGAFSTATSNRHETAPRPDEPSGAVTGLWKLQLESELRSFLARGAEPGAVEYATSLVGMLPVDTPAPEPILEDDGSVVLDWDISRRSTFAVRVR